MSEHGPCRHCGGEAYDRRHIPGQGKNHDFEPTPPPAPEKGEEARCTYWRTKPDSGQLRVFRFDGQQVWWRLENMTRWERSSTPYERIVERFDPVPKDEALSLIGLSAPVTPGDDAGEGKLYARRDTESLSEHYMRHLDAMTTEKLHDKGAIAAELAFRDAQIDALRAEVATLRDCGAEYVRETDANHDALSARIERLEAEVARGRLAREVADAWKRWEDAHAEWVSGGAPGGNGTHIKGWSDICAAGTAYRAHVASEAGKEGTT